MQVELPYVMVYTPTPVKFSISDDYVWPQRCHRIARSVKAGASVGYLRLRWESPRPALIITYIYNSHPASILALSRELALVQSVNIRKFNKCRWRPVRNPRGAKRGHAGMLPPSLNCAGGCHIHTYRHRLILRFISPLSLQSQLFLFA